METFYQHRHVFVSIVMLGAIFSHFFWLHTENNPDPYIIKPSNLSSTRKCDNEPQGTLFHDLSLSYFYHFKAMSLITAEMDHICKDKKPCLYVHKKN